jgi:hypothetical protein
MTEFTLKLKILDAGNKEIYYSVNLTGEDSKHPEDYFYSRTERGKANRLKLIQTIENNLLRKVTDEQLDGIITEWNNGIKRGKSNTTTVTISLESYGSNSNSDLTSPNYSNTTPPIAQPPTQLQSPTQLQPPNYSEPPKVKPPIWQPQREPVIKPSSLENNPPSESPDSPPPVEIRATDNQADF